MAEKNGLSDFDFDKVTKPGKFVKFESGKPLTFRILTRDPMMTETSFGGDEPTVRLNFIVWNFTQEQAQILSAGFGMARTFQRIGKDDDFGADLQKCDIKISPEGEKLNRIYDINVVRHSGNEKELTQDQIRQCAALSLETDLKDTKGRLSEWEPPVQSGYDTAKAQADELRPTPKAEDVVIEDIGDEPINLDDIPF